MSRLVIISSEAAAEQPEIPKIVAAFIEQTLQKWANTEIIQQRLTPQTALDCQTQSQQTDYLALAFCTADWQTDSLFQHYLQNLCFPPAGTPHLTLISEQLSAEVQSALQTCGFRQISWIDASHSALAAHQLAELIACE